MSSTENFTSTESLPESSSSVDNSYESFTISSNDESSQKSSGDNDELSSPTIIELVDHDDGMSATLPQTSEDLSRTLSSFDQSPSTAPMDYQEHISSDSSSPKSSSFSSLAPNESTVSNHLYSLGNENNPLTPTMDKETPLSDYASPSPLQTLVSSLNLPNQQWVIQQSEQSTAVCKISSQSGPSSHTLVITHCVMIKSDLSWTVSVHGHPFDKDKCSALSTIPKKLSDRSLEALVSLLDKCHVCSGHPDKHLVEMGLSKKGQFLSKSGKVSGRVDNYSKVYLNGCEFDTTVRSTNCEMIVQGTKCAACVVYRNSLRKMYHNWMKQKSSSPSHRLSTSSRVNVRYLSTPEKSKRYTGLRSRFESINKENKRLKETIRFLTQSHGIQLQSDIHADFAKIMEEMTEKVYKDNLEGSFRRMFWDQQMKALNMEDSRQVRWHPAMIKWCLHLKFLSSSAYHACNTQLWSNQIAIGTDIA